MSAPGWQQDYPDPSDFFEPLFGSKAINEDDSNNYAFYTNPKLDEHPRTGASRARHRAQVRALRRGESDRVRRRAVGLHASLPATTSVHQPYVRGYHAHPVWHEYLTKTWIDRKLPRPRFAVSAHRSAGLARALRRRVAGRERRP